MPRRREVAAREIANDPIYHSKLLAKFINHVMLDGKKSLAERIVYDALELVADRTKKDPLKVFETAIDNVAPPVEVKSRRVGGATYQVPVEVRESRRLTLAMRWIILYARERKSKNSPLALGQEIIDASGVMDGEGSKGKGGAVKKREETLRMAEANKAFSHYRW